MSLSFINIGGQEMFLLLIPSLLFLVPFIFYLRSLHSTFSAISIENRQMDPGKVWLLLIPIFGIVWHFVVVRDLTESIRNEAISKGIPLKETRPAYHIGFAMCVLSCLIFLPWVGVAVLVCWIIYWVKIVEYKNLLIDCALNIL